MPCYFSGIYCCILMNNNNKRPKILPVQQSPVDGQDPTGIPPDEIDENKNE